LIVLIEYYGDSTIWGADGQAMARVSELARVAKPAPSFVSIPGWHVLNKGVSGQHTGSLLTGDRGEDTLPWEETMAKSGADVVIVNHAINDTKLLNPAKYASNLRVVVSIASNAGKTIVFETPNPTGTTLRRQIGSLLRNGSRRPLGAMVEAMRGVAAELSVPLIDQFAYLTQTFAGHSLRQFVPDLEHPNQATYELKGRFADKALRRLLA